MQKFDLAKDSNKISLHKEYLEANNNPNKNNVEKNMNEMKPTKKELTKVKSVEKFDDVVKDINLNINLDNITKERPRLGSSASLRVEEIVSDSDEEVQNK